MKTALNPFKSKPTKGHTHALVTFDSVGEFVGFVDNDKASNPSKEEMRSRDSFYGGKTWQEAMKSVREGDKDAAKKAERLMAKLTAMDHDTVKRQRVASPYGRVSVGAYLASDPMPCRRKVKLSSPKAPLSVVVNLASSAGVDADAMAARGVAVAALVRKLVLSRPVNLYLCLAAQCYGGAAMIGLVKFPTAPLDSYRLAYLMSDQSFARGVGFSFYRAAKTIVPDSKDVARERYINWTFSDAYASQSRGDFCNDLKDHLREDIFYLPASHLYDRDLRLMIDDPVAWVNKTIVGIDEGVA